MSSSSTPAQILSPPGRVDEPRFGLTFALGIATLLHLLLLLTISAFPGFFIASRVWRAEPEESWQPIKFTFMDLLDDNVVEDNPDAELLSDLSRREAGETPSVTTPEGEEPPSVGNTPERIDGGTQALTAPDTPPEAVQLPRPVPRARPAPEIPPDEASVPEPIVEAPSEATSEIEPPPRGRTVQPGPGSGGVEDGAREESSRRRRDPLQERFSRALDDLSKPLPVDLQALTPPDAAPTVPSAGRSTQWQFDNPNPSYPVKVGHLSFDSKGADFGPWLREFHARVLNEWTHNLDTWRLEIRRNISGARFVSEEEKAYRYAYQMSQIRGVTGVDFVVTREGSVVQLRVLQRSGVDGLDRSVQKTLRNVILPALPDDYPDDTLTIRAGFYYNVRPPR